MKTLTKNQVAEKLNKIAEDTTRTDLVRHTAEIIIDCIEGYEEPSRFFYELWTYGGCKTGMIPHLIYYKDTYEFYDRHQEDILELIQSLREQNINLVQVDFNKNDLSWFAFEQTASDIQIELSERIYNAKENSK